MDKHLGVFITLMNSHLNVSLNYALRVNTHRVMYIWVDHWVDQSDALDVFSYR